MSEKSASRIVFYHNPQSRAAMVRWMLEECGADYELRHVDLQKGENRRPEFLAINPMGKIPTIVVEGTVITEAPAIIAWLADAHPEAGLAPPVGSTERGAWYRWLFFGGSCIEPAMADEMFKRLPVVGTLHELDKPALIQILTQPRNAITRQYQKLFEYENVKLRFTDDSLDAIAEQALARKIGARGLRMIIEDLMLDLMYNLPGQKKIRECVITREVVMSKEKPITTLIEKAG